MMRKLLLHILVILATIGVAIAAFDISGQLSHAARTNIGFGSVLIFIYCILLLHGNTVRSTIFALSHLWRGNDGLLSIKRIIGTAFVIHFIKIVHYAVKNDKTIQYEILLAYVSLISAFFMLTMVPDVINQIKNKLKKTDNPDNTNDSPPVP